MSNEITRAGAGNALMITQQYPAERYNLLVPMQTVAEIADIHKPVMNVVQISTNPADKEIYERKKAARRGQDAMGGSTGETRWLGLDEKGPQQTYASGGD